MSLSGKVIFMSGGSRGIGLAMAKRCARDGAAVVIAAKTDKPHPKLDGTIHTAAAEIEAAGGKALGIVCDIRNEASVTSAVEQAIERFGGIDICIKNASAISLTPTLATPMKRYDLMNGVNARGTYLVSQTCLPHLLKRDNPHILNIAPPLDMHPKWFKPHTAYTMAKYGMSMCTLGLSAEFAGRVGVNSLWPMTAIDTAAVRNVLGGDTMAKMSRLPQIMADAAYLVLVQEATSFTGNFVIDELILARHGVTDVMQYQHASYDGPLMADFFVSKDILAQSKSQIIEASGYTE